MIDDPYGPDFRQPDPGERYYHFHWDKWCTIEPRDTVPDELLPRDETPVRFDNGERAIVKLKSLVEEASAYTPTVTQPQEANPAGQQGSSKGCQSSPPQAVQSAESIDHLG